MKRFLLTIVGLLAFAIGMNAETYTHTFAQDELTTQGGNVALSGIEWTASAADNIAGEFDRCRCRIHPDTMVIHHFHNRNFPRPGNTLIQFIVVNQNHLER